MDNRVSPGSPRAESATASARSLACSLRLHRLVKRARAAAACLGSTLACSCVKGGASGQGLWVLACCSKLTPAPLK